MKSKKIVFMVFVFLLCIGAGFAQTTTKKPAAKKKKPAVAISVYVCDSQKDKVFHKRRTCAGLNKCSGEIKFVTSAAVLKKYKRKSCARCHNK